MGTLEGHGVNFSRVQDEVGEATATTKAYSLEEETEEGCGCSGGKKSKG